MKLYGRLKKSVELIKTNKGEIILDIGCKSAWVNDYIKEKITLINVDIDKDVLIKNKRINPGLNFVVADARFLPFKKKSVNQVLFLEVLEHLPCGAEKSALLEINWVLNKGGRLLLSTPNDSFLFKYLDPAYWLIKHRHYKIERVKSLLSSTNFNVEKSYIGGGFFEVIYLLFFYFFKLFKINFSPKFFINKIDDEYAKEGKNTIIIKASKT